VNDSHHDKNDFFVPILRECSDRGRVRRRYFVWKASGIWHQ